MSGCSACSHGHEAHQHYRPGADCALCDCTGYRRNAIALLKQWMHRTRPAQPLATPVVDKHSTAA